MKHEGEGHLLSEGARCDHWFFLFSVVANPSKAPHLENVRQCPHPPLDDIHNMPRNSPKSPHSYTAADLAGEDELDFTEEEMVDDDEQAERHDRKVSF